MLKSLTSKLVIYTFAISIYPVIKHSSVQAISFESYQESFSHTFYFSQEGFHHNGFLIGKFWGNDNNNDGYITLDYETFFFDDESESLDRGGVEIEYTADNLSVFGKTSYINTLDLGDYFWDYSISSNQLRGRIAELYEGVVVSPKKTCVFVDWADDNSESCSSSPLVIQALPGKNDSGNNSSTKVPEPSSTLGLLAVAALSAGSALLRKRSNK